MIKQIGLKEHEKARKMQEERVKQEKMKATERAVAALKKMFPGCDEELIPRPDDGIVETTEGLKFRWAEVYGRGRLQMAVPCEKCGADIWKDVKSPSDIGYFIEEGRYTCDRCLSELHSGEKSPIERIAEALERIADALDQAVGDEFYHPTTELRDIAEALKGRG